MSKFKEILSPACELILKKCFDRWMVLVRSSRHCKTFSYLPTFSHKLSWKLLFFQIGCQYNNILLNMQLCLSYHSKENAHHLKNIFLRKGNIGSCGGGDDKIKAFKFMVLRTNYSTPFLLDPASHLFNFHILNRKFQVFKIAFFTS